MYVLMTWAHQEGQRNSEMVFFDPSSYFGSRCISQGAEAYHNSFYEHVTIWKIRIRPVPNADLHRKRVGILRAARYGAHGPELIDTWLAEFFTIRDDGTEEWQITSRWQSVGGDTIPPRSETFLVWYQDGMGHTYFDDNAGALYRVSF